MRGFLIGLWSLRRLILIYGLLILGGWYLGLWLRQLAIPEIRPLNEPTILPMVVGILVVYILTAAIPFVPGAEIGFALLLLFGAKAAAVVYFGMVGALILSFSVARFVPPRALGGLLRWAGLQKAAELIREVDETPRGRRADLLSRKLPDPVGAGFVRNRYLALALAINLPGNSVVGGGGGLAFAAGMSGLYRFWPYVAVVCCAVAPVPLLFAFT